MAKHNKSTERHNSRGEIRKRTEQEWYRDSLTYYGLDPNNDPLSVNIGKDVVEDIADMSAMMELARHVAHNAEMGAIIGPAGSGKSLALRHMVHILSDQGVTVVNIMPPETGKVTVRYIAEETLSEISGDSNYKTSNSSRIMYRELLSGVGRHIQSGHKVLIIIDEAQDLARNTIRALKRLWNTGWGVYTMGILLAGQSALGVKLADIPEFEARAQVYRCGGMSAGEIAMLTAHRLGGDVVQEEAIAEIATRARTVYPLYLLRYLRQLLATGYQMDHHVITPETVGKTPMGALYYSIMETHGITIRQIEQTTGIGRNRVAHIMSGVNSRGYAPDTKTSDEVIEALRTMAEAVSPGRPDGRLDHVKATEMAKNRRKK